MLPRAPSPPRRKRPRTVLAAAIVAATGVLLQSCVAVIGADEETRSVVELMCKCQEQLAFLGSPEACQQTLTSRLAGAADETRAAWLSAYVDKCKACPDVTTCFYMLPTCSSGGCTKNEECCSFPSGGTCEQNTCK